MDDRELITKYLLEKLDGMVDKCGVFLPRLMYDIGLPTSRVYPVLRELYDAKIIRVRKGINGSLIFKIKQE